MKSCILFSYLALSSSHCRLFSITLLKSLSLGLVWEDLTESLRTLSALFFAETDSDSSIAVDVYKSPRQEEARHATESEQLPVQVVFSKRVYRFILPHWPLSCPWSISTSPSLSFTTWDLVCTTSAAMSLIRGLAYTLYSIPKIYKWFYRPYYLLSLLMTLAFPLVRSCPGLCDNLPSQREDGNSCAFDWVSALQKLTWREYRNVLINNFTIAELYCSLITLVKVAWDWYSATK